MNRHRLCTYNLIVKETKEKERKKKILVNLIVKETKEKKKKKKKDM